ncbi:MAG: hypothetical protein QM784_24410 [Polyangiaceae bacterium]
MATRRSKRTHVALVASLLPILFLGCAKLEQIETQVCGNSVVEPSALEDCDGYAAEGEYCNPPGAEHACHYSCLDEHRCPSEMACGSDGVCHAGVNTYTAWGKGLSVSASRLLLGDFDGDGRDNLVTLGNANPLWQALPKVVFFDETGNSRDVFDPKLAINSPSILRGSRTEDGSTETITKLLFSVPKGLASLSANSDRIVLPDPYPYQALSGQSAYRVIPISGYRKQSLGTGILVLYGVSDANRALTQLIGAETGQSIGILPKPIEKLVGEFHTADVDTRTESPCDEFLFGYNGEDTVYSVSPCTAEGAWNGGDIANTTKDPSIPVVRLPEGHVVAQPLITGYLNSDLNLDLIVGDGTGHAFVTFGLGNGHFAADPAHADTTVGQAWPLSHDASSCATTEVIAGHPLAMGDLNGDGRDDLVMPNGILLVHDLTIDAANSTVKIQGCAGNTPFVGQWSMAVVDDFTRDGMLDLIAGAKSESDLDFFLGTGRDRMNPFGITTDGSVRHLKSGDFDGDLTKDLAFSARFEGTRDDDTTRETVYIAFGNPNGAPSLVSSIGTFSEVRQLSSADYVDTDAIAELGVVSPRTNTDDGVGEQLAVFIGNAGRHPIAPLGLSVVSVNSGPEYAGTPQAVVSARLANVDGVQISAVALGASCETCQEPDYRLWRSFGTDDSRLENPTVSRVLPSEVVVSLNRVQSSCHLFSGDTNGDDLDEIYLLSATPRSSEIALWPVNADPKVFSTRPDAPDTDAKEPLGSPNFLPGKLLPNSNPVIIDLDDDGHKDLVFLAKQISGTGDEVNRLLVAWNEGGKLAFPSTAMTFDLNGEQPLGFYARALPTGESSSSSSSRQPPRLWTITSNHVFEIPLDDTSRRTRKGRLLELTSTTGSNSTSNGGNASYVPGGQAIAVGDLSGDGLLDLVVATQSGVRVFAETEGRL